jgi:hypothetical protein
LGMQLNLLYLLLKILYCILYQYLT